MRQPTIEDFDVVQDGRTVHVLFKPLDTAFTFHARYGPLAQSYGVYYGKSDDFGDYRKAEVFELAKTLAKAKLEID